MIRIDQIKLPIFDTSETDALKKKICKLLKIDKIDRFEIVKKSIDARHKPDLFYVYSVNVYVANEQSVLSKSKCKQARIFIPKEYKWPSGSISNFRPVIVGMGPAGLFCGYYLALAGCKPVICERGKDVDSRSLDVEEFWNGGELNTESNVQFGEGGAGTFSDGKLNTLVNDKLGRNYEVLKVLVENGAPHNILYDSKPHIGTDILKIVVKNIRNRIIELGGTVNFNSKLTDIIFKNDTCVKACFSNGLTYTTDALVLAIGHSARDTFKMLLEKEIPIIPKAFSVGLRVQHPQKLINSRQYGDANIDKELPAAPYKLTYNTADKRGVFSFCMCPGGYVVNASSENGRLAINGMSYSQRDSQVANSAIIVTVNPDDFEDNSPLGGVEFQRKLEEKAYEVGSGAIPYESYSDYFLSVVNNKDILEDKGKELNVCFKGNAVYSAVNRIMPDSLNRLFVEGMESFDKIIPGFTGEQSVVAGIESRTSSPVRIIRNEYGQSSHKAIYPCGEGAGYAGGITSAAMDGMMIAEEIWKK